MAQSRPLDQVQVPLRLSRRCNAPPLSLLERVAAAARIFTSSVCVCNSRPPSSRLLEGREHGLTIIGDALPISGSRGADLGGGQLAVKSNSTCVPTAPSDHTSLATLNCSGLRRLDCSRPEQGNAARGASKGPRPDFRNASGQRMHRDRKLGGRAAHQHRNGVQIARAARCRLRSRSRSPAIRRAEMRQGLVSLAPTTLCQGSG